ncbi:MAG: FAD-binding oxidoreductase, partial [Actinomycetota bacterium]
WGAGSPVRSRVLGPLELGQLRELVTSRPPRGILARGAGRSYGDAAQNAGGCVLLPAGPALIEPDPVAATVRVRATVTFAELLGQLVPLGLLPPVLPGTRHLTVGGAVAADVHGKNQHGDGSIARWIEEIELLDGNGCLHRLTPGGDRAAFLATAGGMGLTGIILGVTLRLLRIRSTLLQVHSRRLPSLAEVMAAMDGAASRYTVAWIDTTAAGRSLGRGIVELADHLAAPDLAQEPATPAYRAGRAPRAPALPVSPFVPWSARAFNSLWFRKAPGQQDQAVALPAFFHRLDAVSGWNRALGRPGILQYQLAVPDGGEAVLPQVLERIQRGGCAPFLGTLKRFGPASGGPLSFPLPGWSLAVDMPAGNPALGPLLDGLDDVVAAAGGRIYLAKDGRLRRAAFDRMYGDLTGWRSVRARLDPAGVFQSDLGRRIGLC